VRVSLFAGGGVGVEEREGESVRTRGRGGEDLVLERRSDGERWSKSQGEGSEWEREASWRRRWC